MNTEIYIVEEGMEYEGSSIVGVFESLQLAEKRIKKLKKTLGSSSYIVLTIWDLNTEESKSYKYYA